MRLPERQLPLPEMSAVQLARYRRALPQAPLRGTAHQVPG